MTDPRRYDEFVALLQRASGQILAYINALLLNWNDAEDVFQDSCVVLWQKFDEFEPGTNFVAWALRVAQFKVRDFQKSRSRRGGAWNADLQRAMIDDIAQPQVERPEAGLDALADCMQKLGDADRRLVETCYGDDVPVRLLANQMNRSPQSIHNSLRRIRMALLDCIERVAERETRQ